MLAPAIDRFYVVEREISGGKSEGRCRDCHWAYFEHDLKRLRRVFLYHYSEVHRYQSPIDRFTLGTFRTN